MDQETTQDLATRGIKAGDIWEHDGTLYYILDENYPVADNDEYTSVFILLDRGIMAGVPSDHVAHIIKEHIDKQGWTYVGRAKDLVEAGVAALKARGA